MKFSKINSIKKVHLDKPVAVFDIAVKDNNNFVLSSGLVVHNCKPYQYFKSVIYEHRIQMFNNKLLFDEIVGLERDNNSGKVDHSPSGINCFTGDTEVSLVDGRTLSFFELVDEFNEGKRNFVYSFNTEKQKIEPKLITKAWCSGHNAELVEVTLDNGEVLRCTHEHRFMLKDGTYKQAIDLTSSDSLMPLYTRVSDKGLRGYRMYLEPIEGKWHYEHHMFADSVLDKKYLVHHAKALASCNEQSKMLKQLYPTVDRDIFYELFGIQYNDLSKSQKAPWTVKYRRALWERQDHRVKSVRMLDIREDVFDITVEDNHNFALKAGVFVHNSKDCSDAVCGSIWNASQHAEEFAFNYGETLEAMSNASSSDVNFTRNQIVLDFEQELQKMNDPFGNKNNDDSSFVDFGMGKATTLFTTRASDGMLIW